MHVSKVVRARRFRRSYLTTLSVVALLAAQVWDGGIAWAVTPVTAGCTGTTGDMAGLAAAVAAVTTGQTAEIDLVAGCTYTFNSTTPGPLTLAQGITLTIEGNGATITGAASGAIISGAFGGTTPSTLTVDNVTFSGNSAYSGGAIYDQTYGSTLHVTNSRFSNNSAVSGNSGGGAIYANGGTVTIDNSTFASNHADNVYEDGGAIFNSAATITITNSTFSGNTANGSNQYTYGGAIYNTGWLNVTNTTFSGNVAGQWGGAITNYGGQQVIRNSTFSGNTAGVAGAAVYNSFNTLTLSGNLFNANKVSGTVHSCVYSSTTLTDQGYNVADDATCFSGGTGNVSSTAAAIGLGSLAPNGGPTQTMAITSGSSAYHAVAAAKCPSTDQRGHPRLAVSTTFCDAGAFEADGATIPITVTVNGSQTYGSSSPTLTDTASGGSVTGTVSCTGLTVTGNGITTPTAVSSTLAAATGYALAVTGCSGLSTDAAHTISYVGGTFSVTPATISVTVTGSQTYGGSPTFSYPATTGVTGTATCTTVNGGTSIAPTLAASGSYTIDGTSCSGLSTDTSHSISYVGGAFTVSGIPDLGLTLSAGAPYASYGETLVYTAILSNSGSAAATNVGIDFGLSAGFDAVNATWSCSAAGGASCPASSSASMTVPSLPIGGTLTWTLHVMVLTTTPDPTVTVQVSLNGTMQATNTAILVIFRNGFD
jgi:predicted outer membrane repeat protein